VPASEECIEICCCWSCIRIAKVYYSAVFNFRSWYYDIRENSYVKSGSHELHWTSVEGNCRKSRPIETVFVSFFNYDIFHSRWYAYISAVWCLCGLFGLVNKVILLKCDVMNAVIIVIGRWECNIHWNLYIIPFSFSCNIFVITKLSNFLVLNERR
jgi:hypothetical protein